MNDLYLECYYGISGDMTVAALLDLGVDQDKLKATLQKLAIEEEYQIKISKVNKAGIEANDFNVILKGNHEKRNLVEINKILDRLHDEKVKKLAKRIFEVVAIAEARVHGVSIDEVTFHEVGATDSIIDIVSTAFCIVNLKIARVYVSTLYEGEGLIKCKNKEIPIPAPAVLNIISTYHLPLRIIKQEGEMITPTGAAIVAILKSEENLPQRFTIKKIGLGAGKKYPDRPSILRAMIIENL